MAGKVMTQVISISGKLDPSLQRSIQRAGKVAGGLGKGLKAGLGAGAAATGALVAGAGAAATAVGALGISGIKSGIDIQKAVNQMGAATGTYGADLQKLGDTAKAVYENNFGESIEDVTDSLAVVEKTIGGTGEALQRNTENAILLRDTLGYDVSESANAAKTMMEAFGISADEAYGLMAYGAQNGADKNGDMIDTLNEYSSQYSALGLSAEEFMQSLVAGAESGQWSIDKVGDAVKEFNIRAKDGSDSTKEAFKAIGLDADKMGAAFAKGGKSGQEAFFKTVAALDKMTDPMEKNAAAVALFGTQYEDLESSILPTLSSVKGASIDAQGTLEKMGEVKYADVGTAVEGMARKAQVALMPLSEKLAGSLSSIEPQLMAAVEGAVPVITGFVDTAGPMVTQFAEQAGAAISEFTPVLLDAANAALPMVQDLASNLLPQLMGFVTGTVMPGLMQIAQTVMPPLTQAIQAVLPSVQQVGEAFMNLLTTSVIPLIDPLMQLISAILPPLAGLIAGLLPCLEPIIGVVGQIIGGISSLVGWLGDLVSMAQRAADALSKALSGDFGGAAKAMGFAHGGFTKGVSIAGEDPNYPTEAVLSFNPAYRAANVRYWQMAGRMLGAYKSPQLYAAGGFTNTTAAAVGKSLASGGGDLDGYAGKATATYDLSGIVFAPNVTVEGGGSSREDVLAALREAREEFGEMLVEILEEMEEAAYDD